MSEKKVWFITGTSSGFGRALAEEVLANGDRVVATAEAGGSARSGRQISRNSSGRQAGRDGYGGCQEFGVRSSRGVRRIDVLVNNAGYALVGAIEETSDEQIRQQFDTNVFGVLNVTREALPVLREEKSGHIVNIGSVVGFAATPLLGIYSATKFALEGLSEALAGELATYGIKTTLVEPGPFSTNGFSGAVFAENLLPEAYPTNAQFAETFQEFKNIAGDPLKAVRIIIEAVESENPPFRLPLGLMAFEGIEAKLEQVKEEISIWRDRAIKTDFDAVANA